MRPKIFSNNMYLKTSAEKAENHHDCSDVDEMMKMSNVAFVTEALLKSNKAAWRAFPIEFEVGAPLSTVNQMHLLVTRVTEDRNFETKNKLQRLGLDEISSVK